MRYFSLFVFVSISASIAKADINNFANNAVAELNRPFSATTKERAILYGGGFNLRSQSSTFYPLNIQAPSVKSGCGGIDLTFGSLSFLNADQLVAFMQNILAAAPGVAFDLALKALCPSCSDTLKSLESMANQINHMSMNSCSAAKQISSLAIYGNLNSLPQERSAEELNKHSTSDSWLDRINSNYLKNANQFLSEFNSVINSVGCSGPGCKALKFFTGDNPRNSLIDFLFLDAHPDLSPYSGAFRAMVGDVIKITPSGDRGGQLIWLSSIDGELFSSSSYNSSETTQNSNTKQIIKRLMGENVNALDMATNGNKTVATWSPGGLVNSFESKIESIINKLETRAAPSDSDLEFLSMFRDPVYKMFNLYATLPSGTDLLRDKKRELAKMLASEYVYHFISDVVAVLSRFNAQAESVRPYLSKTAYDNPSLILRSKEMAKYASSSARIAYLEYFENYNRFAEATSKTTTQLKNIKELRNFTLARTSPELFANYLYSKGISNGGR